MLNQVIIRVCYLGLLLSIAHSKELAVGRLDNFMITQEASELVCLGFEADHPKNKCKDEKADADRILNDLIANQIQVAIVPEELVMRFKDRDKINIILPLYQQYFMMISNGSFSFDSLKSLEGKKIGVQDDLTKGYRLAPLFKTLGLSMSKVQILSMDYRQELVDEFCQYNIDGVFIMTHQSSAVVRELTTACDGKILSLSTTQQAQFIKRNLSFSAAYIPAHLYWRMDKDINTFSSRLILISNKEPDVLTMLSRSMEHILDEVLVPNLRQFLTPATILESYQIREIALHPMGLKFINELESTVTPESPNDLISIETTNSLK